MPDRVPVFEYIRETYGKDINIVYIATMGPHEARSGPSRNGDPRFDLFGLWTQKQWTAQRAGIVQRHIFNRNIIKPDDFFIVADDMPQSIQHIVGANWKLTTYILDADMRILAAEGRFADEARNPPVSTDRVDSKPFLDYLRGYVKEHGTRKGGSRSLLNQHNTGIMNRLAYAVRESLALPPDEKTDDADGGAELFQRPNK